MIEADQGVMTYADAVDADMSDQNKADPVSPIVQIQIDLATTRVTLENLGKQTDQQSLTITHRLDQMQHLFEKRLDEISKELSERYVTKEAFKPLESEVISLRSHVTWLVRLALGAIVSGVIAFVLSGRMVGH